MDTYPANEAVYPPTQRQSIPYLPNLQTRHFQRTPQRGPQTLPPLNRQRTAPTYSNGLQNNSSRPSPASYSANESTVASPFGQYDYQSPARFQGIQTPFPQTPDQYTNSPSYYTQSPDTLSYQQNNGPVPLHGRLPDLRPMPAGGLSQSIGPAIGHASSTSISSNISNQEQESPPTHVVGSQGRRGILPSATGRPAAVSNGTSSTSKASATPSKDADGKFPCPHCNKTYLHAKHLKRHLLRHTGDRPYMCILCKDTFSRSDILKRHFQKCSLRRGNPTGATHLSHSHAHLKKSQNGARKSVGDSIDTITSQRPLSDISPTFGDEDVLGLGISNYQDELRSISDPVSRANSVVPLADESGLTNRRSFNGSIASGFSRSAVDLSQGHIAPHSLALNSAGQLGPSFQHTQNGHVTSAGSASVTVSPGSMLYSRGAIAPTSVTSQDANIGGDWPDAFQSSARDGYFNPLFPSTIVESHSNLKTGFPTTNNGAALEFNQLNADPYVQA